MTLHLKHLRLLVILIYFLPLRISSTSCAVSSLRSDQEFGVEDGIMFTVNAKDARTWKWSAQSKSGLSFPVAAAWIGQSQLVLLSSPRFKPGHEYFLLIDGRTACEYFCGENDKKNKFVLKITNRLSAGRIQNAETWDLSAVEINDEGSSVKMSRSSQVSTTGRYYIVSLEDVETEANHEKTIQSYYLQEQKAGQTTVSFTNGTCTADAIRTRYGHSYRLSIFRPYRNKFIKEGGWSFTVPDRENFTDAELSKVKELERLYAAYLGDTGNGSKNEALHNWVKNNKDLHDKYLASNQKYNNIQGKDLNVVILHGDQIPDLQTSK